MRWPLKNQIFLRVFALLSATIVAITFANIRSRLSNHRERELERVQEIGIVLTSTRFPLNTNVLESMSRLSGAQFIVSDQDDVIVTSTRDAPRKFEERLELPANSGNSLAAKLIEVDERRFLYAPVSVLNPPGSRKQRETTAHVFMPQENQSVVFWNASKSPLAVAAIVLPIALVISLALANQVTKPLSCLQQQVEQIAKGNIQQIQSSSRDDEIRDLNLSINEMTLKLQDHERQIRQNERLATLLQLGSGLAHNLRNSATGCRMALEHLANEDESVNQSESMDVARRQLNLMESYIRKFMNLSESDAELKQVKPVNVDLSEMMRRVIFMLRPSASHLNVDLQSEEIGTAHTVLMHEDDALQLMTNLIMNAITAASENPSANGGRQHGQVLVTLARHDRRIFFSVSDTGPGPPPDIADRLFQPFVSSRQEGTGLGLSLVQEIADRVGGSIAWSRENGKTVFTFRFNQDAAARE